MTTVTPSSASARPIGPLQLTLNMRYLPRWLLIGLATLIMGLMAIGIIEKLIGGFDHP